MIRKAAVAGMFYPANPEVLSRDVDNLLTEATAASAATGVVPGGAGKARGKMRAVIVPHAGYIYSGLTAATAYALVGKAQREAEAAGGALWNRIVIVGPTHRVAVYGCAYSTAKAWATPLGEVAIWQGTAAALAGVPGVAPHDDTHREEHAIETQLPFLQKVLPGLPFTPINAGAARPEVVADVIEHLLTDDTLLVISSDLSHYLPYDTANEIDAFTLGQILALGGPLEHEQACGATPINGLLEVARRREWEPVLLAACNSGDTAGDEQRVVGYCAFAFYDGAVSDGTTMASDSEAVAGPESATSGAAGRATEAREATGERGGQAGGVIPESAGAVLIAQARAAIEGKLGIAQTSAPQWGPWAELTTGTFVTLNKNGELRGCIGSLVDDRPLDVSIPANALNAAFRDPRFPAVTAAEWPEITVEVSLLTEPAPVLVDDGKGGFRAPATEAEALAALKPGVDGVIFKSGYRQSTFLPQVWEQLPEPEVFLAHLRAKAGVAPDYWGKDVELLRYRVKAWEE